MLEKCQNQNDEKLGVWKMNKISTGQKDNTIRTGDMGVIVYIIPNWVWKCNHAWLCIKLVKTFNNDEISVGKYVIDSWIQCISETGEYKFC